MVLTVGGPGTMAPPDRAAESLAAAGAASVRAAAEQTASEHLNLL